MNTINFTTYKDARRPDEASDKEKASSNTVSRKRPKSVINNRTYKIDDVSLHLLVKRSQSIIWECYIARQLRYTVQGVISQKIFRALQRLKRLSSLSLTQIVKDCQSFSYLDSTLKHLASLSALSLSSPSHQVTGHKAFETFSRTLKCCYSLSKIDLDFCCSDSINEYAIKYLSHGLKYLSNVLSSLTLNLCNCIKVNDKALETFSAAIRYASSLLILDLNFASCPRISDKGIKYLASSLKNIRLLRVLRLNFYDCSNITDQGFTNLSSNIKHLVHLFELNLSFAVCTKLTDEGIESLSLSFQSPNVFTKSYS